MKKFAGIDTPVKDKTKTKDKKAKKDEGLVFKSDVMVPLIFVDLIL